jgi:hypothetical protein
MAKFSQGFLSSLGRPAFSQSLFDLGAAIGGIPGQLQERKKKEQELQVFNQIAQASEQGTAAALEGNVEGVRQRIAQLSQARDAAKDLPTKQNIQKAIDNLQRQLPGAKKISVGNKARELVNIEQQLASLPSGATAQRLALQKRQEVLQNDPEAMRQYQQYQLDTFRYEQAEKEVQAEQWLNSNRAPILEAIEAGDTDKLTSIIEGAGDFVGAAQKFANAALQSAENMAKFEENSMEQKIEPSVDYYTEQVNNLPEEIGKNLKSTLEAYTRVSKEGWDGKQWNTGARIRAKRLEKDLQSQLRAINSQIATSAYFEGRREEARIKQQIKEIEIKLDTPMGSKYIKEGRIMAQTLLGKDEVTEAEINKYAQQLYDRDQQQLRQQLAALTGEKPAEEEEENYESWQLKIIQEAMDDNPNRSREEIIRMLKQKGLLSEEPEAEELGILDQRIAKQKRRFSDELGTRDERMAALGTREQRMAALPR